MVCVCVRRLRPCVRVSRRSERPYIHICEAVTPNEQTNWSANYSWLFTSPGHGSRALSFPHQGPGSPPSSCVNSATTTAAVAPLPAMHRGLLLQGPNELFKDCCLRAQMIYLYILLLNTFAALYVPCKTCLCMSWTLYMQLHKPICCYIFICTGK